MGKQKRGGKADGKRKAPTPKKRSKLGLMGAAALLILPRRKPKKVAPEVADKAVARSRSKSIWRAFVTAIRPLHHHHQLAPASRKPTPLVKAESFHDVLPGPPSPGYSSADSMSQYFSAEEFPTLDSRNGGEDEKEDGGWDEEIDSKAEEFIAKFYEQIRLEKLACDGYETIEQGA